MLRRSTLVRSAVVFALLGVTPSACQPDRSQTSDTPSARSVRVATVERQTAPRMIRVTGVSRAVRRANLSFVVGGRLEQLLVGVGDSIEAGQIVARLDERPFQHQLSAARARSRQSSVRAGQARRDHRRARELTRAGAFATADLESAQSARRELTATVAGTQVDVREARRQLDEATLVAPFDAVVSAVSCQPQEFIVPGQPVITLNGIDGVEVQVEIPEAALAQVQVGDTAAVRLPLVGIDGLEGVVHAVGEAAVPGGLFPVVIRLDDVQTVRAGATVEVSLALRSSPRLTVPSSAVVRRPGSSPHVLKVEDGRALRVDVDVTTLEDEHTVIEGPLAVGDVIVARDAHLLLDGEAVEVAT